MSPSDLAGFPRHGRRPGPAWCVVFPPVDPGVMRRPGAYAPCIVIVIVIVLAVIGAPGQVEAALFALAAVLPLLGFRAAEPA
jgi:hypothetical protein